VLNSKEFVFFVPKRPDPLQIRCNRASRGMAANDEGNGWKRNSGTLSLGFVNNDVTVKSAIHSDCDPRTCWSAFLELRNP
jgi:hypothetical protein